MKNIEQDSSIDFSFSEMEVVHHASNHNMSPTIVVKYKKRKLVELFNEV